MLSKTAFAHCAVLLFPCKSFVRFSFTDKVFSIEFKIDFAASFSPKWSSIKAPDHICPIGFAIPFPAMSGAEPWTGSNRDGYLFSGL